MTEEEATALGKRLAACRHFRPMPGLKDMQGRTWDDSLLWRWNREVDVPDLRQPASMGILLACVREAWGNDHIVETRQFRTFGEVYVGEGRCFVHPTLADSLVAALEAAP